MSFLNEIANDPIVISVLFAITIASISIFAIAVAYQKSSDAVTIRGGKKAGLFDDFYLKLYSAFFDDQDPDDVAIKLGIKIEDYYKICKTTGTKPNAKKLIVHKLEAIILVLIGVGLGLFIHMIFAVICVIFALYLFKLETSIIENKAKALRTEIADDVPRFMDLLKTEVDALPIEIAIYALCEKMDCLLTSELNTALNEMEFGANSWIGALEKIAEKYDVDTLNSLVLDISTAYNKGVSVAGAIKRKAKEIRDANMLRYEEKASSMTSQILLPIMIFQLLPLLMFILIPVFSSLDGIF